MIVGIGNDITGVSYHIHAYTVLVHTKTIGS